MSQESMYGTGTEQYGAQQESSNITTNEQGELKVPTTLLEKVGAENSAGQNNQQGISPDANVSMIPDNPADYRFQFDETMPVDETLLNGFRSTAKDLGLNQQQAQSLAGLYANHMQYQLAEQQKQMQTTIQEWEQSITQSPSFEQDKRNAQYALNQFGSDDVFQLLNESMLGSHPVMFSFISRIGKALAEPSFRGRGNGATPLTAEKILYPTMK